MWSRAAEARQQPPTERDPLLTTAASARPAAPGAGDTAAGDKNNDDDDPLVQGVVQPARKWIVEPATLMFCIGMLSQVSVVSQYLYFRVGQRYNETVNATRAFVCNSSFEASVNSSEHQLTSRIQSEATEWTMYRNIVASVFALLLTPIYASSSDYLGRKPALLLPCIGMALDSGLLVLVMLLELPLPWLVVSGGLGALGGGFGALFAAIFAYLADTTTRRERPVRIAIVEGTFGLAGGAMELLIGWWIHLMGYTIPMVFSAAITLVNVLYIVFLVPEVRPRSLLHQRHQKSSLAGPSQSNVVTGVLTSVAAPFRNIAGLFSISARLSVTLGLLLAAIGTYSTSFIGSSAVGMLYQMNYPFCLDSVFIGYLNAAKIVGFQLGVAVALLLFRRCCGVQSLGLSIIGLLSAMLGSLATGMASSTIWLFVASGIALFSMLPIPMLRAYTSHIAPPSRQGALFSCIGMLEVLGSLIGTTTFTLLYKSTQDWLSGFVYLAVSCTTLLAIVLAVLCALVNCCCWPKTDKDCSSSSLPTGESETRTVNYDS